MRIVDGQPPGTNQVPILPCGRCGSAATPEQGVIATASTPERVRFRCRASNDCLSGPMAEPLQAIHGWNRVTQGWVAMDILINIEKGIPSLGPQIRDAMEQHFELLTKEPEHPEGSSRPVNP